MHALGNNLAYIANNFQVWIRQLSDSCLKIQIDTDFFGNIKIRVWYSLDIGPYFFRHESELLNRLGSNIYKMNKIQACIRIASDLCFNIAKKVYRSVFSGWIRQLSDSDLAVYCVWEVWNIISLYIIRSEDFPPSKRRAESNRLDAPRQRYMQYGNMSTISV